MDVKFHLISVRKDPAKLEVMPQPMQVGNMLLNTVHSDRTFLDFKQFYQTDKFLICVLRFTRITQVTISNNFSSALKEPSE